MLKALLPIALFLSFYSHTVGQIPEPESAQSHFNQGLQSLHAGSFEAAISSFERSAILDPNQSTTFANIAEAAIQLKRYDKAESAVRTSIKLSPNEGPFYALLCKVLSLQKKHIAAIQACEDGVRLSPSSEATHATRITAYQHAGRPSNDIQRLIETSVDKFPGNEFMLALAGEFYLANRNFAQAALLLETLVTLKPNSATYRGMLAEVYLKLEREVESLALARSSLRLDPQNPYANYALGLIFYELGQHEEAIESFSKVKSMDPRLSFAKYFLAKSESRRGRHKAAVVLLRELVAEYPERAEFQFELATTLDHLGALIDAEGPLIKANALMPNTPDILIFLGVHYGQRAQFDKAIQYFEEAFRLRPGSEHIKMFLDVARGRQNLIPQIPSLIKTAEADPKNVKAQLDIASVLVTAGRAAEADKYFERIYKLDPPQAEFYQLMGVELSEAGEVDRSVEAYRMSLRKKENPGAYLGLAAIFSDRGDFESASAAYAKVIELKPDTPNIMKSFGDLLQSNGKRREALAMYKRSLAISPLNANTLLQAGILSMRLGEKDAARSYLAALRSVDIDNAKILERFIALDLWN